MSFLVDTHSTFQCLSPGRDCSIIFVIKEFVLNNNLLGVELHFTLVKGYHFVTPSWVCNLYIHSSLWKFRHILCTYNFLRFCIIYDLKYIHTNEQQWGRLKTNRNCDFIMNKANIILMFYRSFQTFRLQPQLMDCGIIRVSPTTATSACLVH